MWLWGAVAVCLAGQADRWASDVGSDREVHVVWDLHVPGSSPLERPTQRRTDTGFRLPLAGIAENHRADATREDRISLPDGSSRLDLSALVLDHVSSVEDLAQSLRGDAYTPEAFADRAMQFVQAIPYEARHRSFWGEPVQEPTDEQRTVPTEGYRHYRRPLSLLDDNRGDCDGKAVLFLAPMRAMHPDVQTMAVRIPGQHVFAAVAIDGWDPGMQLTHEGVTYTVIDPTGPRFQPAGRLGSAYRERQGDFEYVPVRPKAKLLRGAVVGGVRRAAETD